MTFLRLKILVLALIIISILATADFFVLSSKGQYTKNQIAVSGNSAAADVIPAVPSLTPLPRKLSNPPAIIKAVYVTGYSAGTKYYKNYLTGLFKNTQINAVVVDIKGSDGYVTYASLEGDVVKYHLTDYAISDIDSLVRFFHDQNIYVIGRISVFEDPIYSKARPNLAIYNKKETTNLTGDPFGRVLWQDNYKISWLDPASKDVWSYNISLAKDAFAHGFDEINFDYVRFPTDGKAGDMGFPVWDGKTPMAGVVKEFFQYTRSQLQGQKISIDLFGQTTTNKDDMGIGQIIENAFENFDYISPMVYPSHYADGFLGFINPAEHPYEIIKYEMDGALSKEAAYSDFLLNISSAGATPEGKGNMLRKPLAKFRPWLQDFNMGTVYNADMVKQEIQATQDALGNDYSGFMLWNPSNVYTRDAILKPN